MNDKFLELPEEKQQAVINAAMEVFSQNEYKRASTDLIAAKAGVSKGLLFYYFHNKKELYFYLYDYVAEVMRKQVIDRGFLEERDFFGLLRYSALKKSEILKKNPYFMDFAVRAFYSEKEDVSEELKQVNRDYERELYQQFFSGLDLFKFKEGVEPFRVYKMLVWMADGYMHDLQTQRRRIEPGELMKEFDEWMEMFRRLTYREEYLEKTAQNNRLRKETEHEGD